MRNSNSKSALCKDLSLIKTNDLIDELLNRFPDMVFSGIRVEEINGKPQEYNSWAYSGQYGMLFDMLYCLLMKINQAYYKQMTGDDNAT